MTRFAIVGYGNLGKACERVALSRGEVAGIFTRRDPSQVHSPFGVPVYKQSDIFKFEDSVDVAVLCVGSANDAFDTGVKLASRFNTADSFDTHAKMGEYINAVSRAAFDGGKLSVVGAGWDPGLFSLIRALLEGVAPNGTTYTFWGRGVSQGHSEAIRRVEGVEDAKQYTVPNDDALKYVENGGQDKMESTDMHRRECYVALKDGADKIKIESQIKNMPNYFKNYDTDVHFIEKSQLESQHGGMAHAGKVYRNGSVNGFDYRAQFGLTLDSNPDFTASVLISYAIAVHRLNKIGERGARTILDIPVSALFDGDATRFV